jgi:hypothetical protein
VFFPICWEAPPGVPTFGFGKYLVSIVPDNHINFRQFFVDYRSSDIYSNYQADVNIIYNCSNGSLTCNGNTIQAYSTIQYWDLYPNTYAPIIRQIATSGSPHLVWDAINGANIGNYFLYEYIIYRSINAGVATAICTTSSTNYNYYDYDFTVRNRNPTAHY